MTKACLLLALVAVVAQSATAYYSPCSCGSKYDSLLPTLGSGYIKSGYYGSPLGYGSSVYGGVGYATPSVSSVGCATPSVSSVGCATPYVGYATPYAGSYSYAAPSVGSYSYATPSAVDTGRYTGAFRACGCANPSYYGGKLVYSKTCGPACTCGCKTKASKIWN